MTISNRLGHRSLKDLVAERIRQSILDGQLELGTRLTETAVAEELGVSRGPVREAFLTLAREGLLKLNPRRGISVATLPPDEIWQLYTLRAHLEALLIRHGMSRFTPGDLDYLQELVDEMRLLSQGSGSIARATELDLKFHGRIATRCPFSRMVESYRALDGQVGAGIYTVVKVLPGTLERFAHIHQVVLDALRTGDPGVAEAAVQAHWIYTADRIRSAMQTAKGETS